VELDQAVRQAYLKGQAVHLNRKEYALLELFLRYPKRIFSKANLAAKIWKQDCILMGNTIAATLTNLRKKIGRDFIKTIKGVGYYYSLNRAACLCCQPPIKCKCK
jgi:DNA-binding response OmpR family regulator